MERRRYGRMWMQQGYFGEAPNRVAAKHLWQTAADLMKTVNDQVLEDIEDLILLEGFGNKSKKEIQ